jgi:transcriptional regulator with XRE-family HTH domain
MPRRKIPDETALAIGQRIRQLREEAGLTMEAVAYEGELRSKGHLSSLERGLVMPTIATLKRIAERLGVHVADLVVDPNASEREALIDLTRGMTIGAMRKLTRELSSAKSAAAPARAARRRR